MSHGGFYIPRLFKYLPRDLEGKTILDAGSGLGEVAYYIHAFTGRQSCDFSGTPLITGVDINKQSVEWTWKYLTPRIYFEVVQLDLIGLEKRFPNRHWDIGLMLEVPEHIPKEKALKVLDQLERMCDYIIVATPLGDELNQDYGDVIPEFNHVSMWTVEDFTKRGYKVWVEEVSPIPRSVQLFRWILYTYAHLRGRKSVVQQKIIAVRNLKNIPMSEGINFAGLRK